MLLNIVFSFNRAMQLDCFLNSFIMHFKSVDYEIAVIYHTTGNHKKGYKKLKEKYLENSKIQFYERSGIKFYFYKILPLLFRPKNLYRFVKYDYLRSNVDNFKFLMERIIDKSQSEFLMFSTDDTYYDNDIIIDKEIFEKIRKKPYEISYRLFLGENIKCANNLEKQVENDRIYWNYYENIERDEWGYPFTVDGTIYHKNEILQIIKKIIYHMPSTLESYTNTYVCRRNLFDKGICPKTSCLTNIFLNRVEILGYHQSLNIDVDMLNKKFMEGYSIEYKYKKPVREWGTIPDKVVLKNSKNVIVLK